MTARLSECLQNLVKNKNMKQKEVSIPFMALGVLFCICLIASNLFATKQIAIGSIEMTGALFVFPVSYIINDCIVEVWGYRKMRFLIWLGFFMNALFVFFGLLVDWLPAAPYWSNNDGFHQLFGLAPRIVLGSFIAFLAGSFLNAYVMSAMKVVTRGKGFSVRAIISTLAGESADSLFFFPIALGGVIPWDLMPMMMISQALLKSLYELLILPVTIRIVKYIKQLDGTDVYDEHISYNILKIKDL